MLKDPIVEQVRQAGARLCEEAGNNLHAFCEQLRKLEQNHSGKLVRRTPKLLARPPVLPG